MTSIEILETLMNTAYPQHLELSCKIYRKQFPEQMKEIDDILQKEISKRNLKKDLVESEN